MSKWDNYCDEIGGVCKDMEAQAARIAELEAERDRLREALKEVLNCEVVTDTGDYSKGDTGFDCNEVKEIVFKTLKGKPHDR